MLYEVITKYVRGTYFGPETGVSPKGNGLERPRKPGSRARCGTARGLPGPRSRLFPGIPGVSSPRSPVRQGRSSYLRNAPFRDNLPRITSYNVCYTKLLRLAVHPLERLRRVGVLHILDESYLDPAITAVVEDIDDLVVIDPFERYHVDLDLEPRLDRLVDTGKYFGKDILRNNFV